MLAIYDAIEDDSALARLCETVAAACGARSANIQHRIPGGGQPFMQISYFPADYIPVYSERFLERDPWRRQAAALGITGRAVAMDDYIPPEAFARTEIYNDLFRPMGDDTGRCMGMDAKVGTAALHVAVHRPLAGRAFDPSDRARLEEVFGHVGRALHLRRLLEGERAHIPALERMVEGTEKALLIVDRTLRIVTASPAAAAILDGRDGLACREGRLTSADQMALAGIHAAVSRTIDRASVLRSGFLCRRPSGRAAYRLLVLPAGASGDAGALISIDVPDRCRSWTARQKALAEAYGFTTAESALAERLVRGFSLEEIAAERGVGLETIRTQLKSIFAKTDTHRQADVVALLA